MFVKFTDEGIPGWFGPEPVEGSVPLDMATLPDGAAPATFLPAHQLVAGEWVAREPVKVHEPPPEEVAAAVAEAYQAALAAREDAIDVAVLASDAYRQFLRGGMTLAAYRDAASEIAAGFPMPDPHT